MTSVTAISDYSSFCREVIQSANLARRPIIGTIALTYHCNLDCVHCYLRSSRKSNELSTEEWLDIIDQLDKAGCLWLVITGGEPLLRADFRRIYQHAKKKGMLVVVFTNGTLVDDSLVAFWSEWSPHVVEMTLYGYTQEVYSDVTGSAQARDASFDAVGRLVDAAIPLRLKTMALRQNRHELRRLEQFCRDQELRFRFDPFVSPELDGSLYPCQARLDNASIIQLDIENRARMKVWADCLGKQQRLPSGRSLFNCSAGKSSFFIGPDGLLSLCLFDVPVYDLKEGPFLEGWKGAVQSRRATSLPKDHPCWGCPDQTFCGVCPPLARMETGSDLGVPQRQCELGKSRSRAVLSSLEGVKPASVGG